MWREVYRVLKPGGHALVFAGTRTQDLMTIALRMAGFEVRDVIEWLYFSGFPKSMDIGKALDKRAGAEREVIGSERNFGRTRVSDGKNAYGDYVEEWNITTPATELARKWDGWGTALKPAHEPVIVVRKPLTGTVADNVEKYGTGAINIDGCRIKKRDGDRTEYGVNGDEPSSVTDGIYGKYADRLPYVPNDAGRFPANCVTTEEDAFYSPYFNVSPHDVSKKASKKDRNADWTGAEIVRDAETTDDGRNKSIDNPFLRGETARLNSHPTVKPIDLMAWLIRLVTPTGGVILDPFAGSGTTLVAAKREGFGFVCIEREPEYIEIIEARTGESRMMTDEEFEALLA